MLIFYIAYGVVGMAFVIAAIKLHKAKKLFLHDGGSTVASSTVPSVSVCIPARNESHAMTESLQRVLGSTYEKLEILVADDHSGDTTPALIKAFAHEGVRFIEVPEVPEGWLGKNFTLNTLLKEASGRYILFLDVDTHLSPRSIERLVSYAQKYQASMVSVMPRREDGLRASTVCAPLRYFWEIMFHRTASPAVASSAWLIDRASFIKEFTDFSQLGMVIQPEAHVAATYAHDGRYRFLISTPFIGVRHEKKWQSQVDTSTRLLFPLLGSRLVNAVIVALDLLILASPIVLVIIALVLSDATAAIVGFGVLLLGVTVYSFYLRMIWQRGWLVGSFLWPLIVLQEACLVIRSTYQYKRHLVTWKGRSVSK